MSLNTAIPPEARSALEQLGEVDIVAGIPSYANAGTISYVAEVLSLGLQQCFPGLRSLIINSDGGSPDGTCAAFMASQTAPGVSKSAFAYQGLPGKGSAMRAVFEASVILHAKACLMVDSDLRSITPEWVKLLAGPVVEHGHDYVAPFYTRHKYDGTITNNIAYPLTRALYGFDLRQPIGGDFGLSGKMAQIYLQKDVWGTDVARFGIDIWMTTTAINETANVAQAALGAKIHDPKDPAGSLGPMFAQVVGTCFSLMEPYEHAWESVTASHSVPLYGEARDVKPEPVEISLEGLQQKFEVGARDHGALWRAVIKDESYRVIEGVLGGNESYSFTADVWVRIVYDYAVAFNSGRWLPERQNLIASLIPLYYGRTASFVEATAGMLTREAEAIVQSQAGLFEELKPYLHRRWQTRQR